MCSVQPGGIELGIDIQTAPAFAQFPGVTVTEDGVVFSTVFRGYSSCGIELYHLPDGTKTQIPFTQEHRFGSLYSVKIFSLQPEDWCYRYYCGKHSFVDPYARKLVEVHVGDNTISAAGFFYTSDDRLPVYTDRDLRPWNRESIYCLHVRGFTMGEGACVRHPGTFTGVSERIPYLKKLGITAVELMPVYELRPDTRPGKGPQTMQDALDLYPVDSFGKPILDLSVERSNYWGFGRGFYFAPRKSYGTGEEDVQIEFAQMIEKFHAAGMEVILQMFFPDSVSPHAQDDAVRFYTTHYGVDGFHLLGHITNLKSLVSDPLLSDTKLIGLNFPYDEIRGVDAENPESGIVSTANLAQCGNSFTALLRRFVKSDDYVLKDFLAEFLRVPQGHGNIHAAATYDGFTLRDLVSYNDRHNEANGESGLDGCAENYSWNCGCEGETDNPDILKLRRNQIRNFLTLLYLSQGTPFLNEGDEYFNTQGGNNNPYCQDNAVGWVDWTQNETADEIIDFTRKIQKMRSEHPVFHAAEPFKGIDYLACGYPDLSLHGEEAWKPDLNHFSHCIGICLCENYVKESNKVQLIYLAINMYWEERSLGLPKLQPRRYWNLLLDTSKEDSFTEGECIQENQHSVSVAPRSVKILNTITSNRPPKKRRKTARAVVRALDGSKVGSG